MVANCEVCFGAFQVAKPLRSSQNLVATRTLVETGVPPVPITTSNKKLRGGGHYNRLEAIAIRLEAIPSRLEARTTNNKKLLGGGHR